MFEIEMSTIVGEVALSATFLAFAGVCDQHYRDLMSQEWSGHLAAVISLQL